MARESPRKPWSFLAYIAGDNDLSDFGLEDVTELCETGASPKVHAAVQIDTYGEHTGSVRYEISEPDWTGKSHRVVIERLPEQDTGNPKYVSSFVRWGLGRYRADKRLLVMWNHGSGFRQPERRNIAYDDFGTSLDMPMLASALAKGGVTESNKVSVLGFDACLMNMLEIAHHFRNRAEVLVGSQQVEPGDGWPYDRVLGCMHRNPTARELGREIVDAYVASYRAIGEDDVTQSAIDLAKTPRAVAALDAFGEKLAPLVEAKRSQMVRRRLSTQSYEYADYVDLVHLATQFRDFTRGAADQLVSATRACVIASGSLGRSVKSSHGLSVWFPTSATLYARYRAKYLRLESATAGRGWVSFLDTFFST